MARLGLAGFVNITPSQYIPGIQEALASAYHALHELVEISKNQANAAQAPQTA